MPAASLRSLAFLLAWLLAGCVETGDLGRPKRSPLGETAAGMAGSLAATIRGEQVSGFIFTDDEQELRNRAWRFLMPAHERSWFERILAELARTRVLPVSAHPIEARAYHRALMTEARRSPHSAYRRISEDALADARLLQPFSETASRVLAADTVRRRSLSYVQNVGASEVREAAARVAENLCLVAWVRAQAAARTRSYRYALERLLIEAPQGEAAGVEKSLALLVAEQEGARSVLGPLPPEPACWGALDAVFVAENVAVVPAPPRPGLVKK
jgi:hypothetical protein